MTITSGMRVSFQIWDVRISAMNTLTGKVVKVYGGANPLVQIKDDEPAARQNPSKIFKLRISNLTQI